MKSNWNYPTTVWVGENRVKELSIACTQVKIKNPLFVTDNDLANLPMVQNIILQLKSKFKNLNVFTQFSGNPNGENVEEGVKKYIQYKSDGVIALGGGSALDVGKAIAFMCSQTRKLHKTGSYE